MRTIQIAPNREDCRIEGKKVIGTMDGRTFIFELPDYVNDPKSEEVKETMISNFREAIALCSKPWQVEDLLNRHWQFCRRKTKGYRVQVAQGVARWHRHN